MSGNETAWQAEARRPRRRSPPEAGELASLDMAGLGEATLAVLLRAAEKPGGVAAATLRFWTAMARIGPVAAARWLGSDATPPVPAADDRRFADRTWHDNPAFFAVRQAYLAAERLTSDLLAAGAGDAVADSKAELASGFLLDVLAPTNFLLTNPAAIKRAMETGGASLAAGARNFLVDVLRNGGRPRQVDTSSFVIGGNLAATPGKIVFRNELMELIQYAPQTPRVRAVPMLASPPWINKYYIMDLAPGRSFIEWAVQHERTVFAISYRNPDASMRGVTLDDYLIRGPIAALDVIADITGAPKIDITGLCLGGALTGMLAAYLAGTGDDRIGSLTLLNTMLDYSQPGALGAFTDERTVARLEREMAKKGYLEGSSMAGTFDMLRANDLIFSYVVSGWLMGQPPPNLRPARLERRQHPPAGGDALVLPAVPVHEKRARPGRDGAGRPAAGAAGGEERHLRGGRDQRPHRALAGLLPGHQAARRRRPVRLVQRRPYRSIVNPPGPKAWYEVADGSHADAAGWRDAATRQAGSWWEDWTKWAQGRVAPASGRRAWAASGTRRSVTRPATTSGADSGRDGRVRRSASAAAGTAA